MNTDTMNSPEKLDEAEKNLSTEQEQEQLMEKIDQKLKQQEQIGTQDQQQPEEAEDNFRVGSIEYAHENNEQLDLRISRGQNLDEQEYMSPDAAEMMNESMGANPQQQQQM